MRYSRAFLCVFALGLMGCGEAEPAFCAGVVCEDGNECTEDVCDPQTGTCDYAPVTDGTACDYGALPGLCKSGECVDAMLCEGVVCEDGNPCTLDSCDPMSGTCRYAPVEDGMVCDFGGRPGVCQRAVCVSVCELDPCDDNNPCTEDACDIDDGSCTNEPVADNTACDLEGMVGVCEAGECVKKRSWATPEFFAGAHLEKAAFDASGRALVVWVLESEYVCRPGDFTVPLQCVWANRFVPGAGWEHATELGCEAPVCCYHCGSTLLGFDVAADPAGNAFAVWTSVGHLSTWTSARRFTPSGGWGDRDNVLDIYPEAFFTWARIAADGEGNAIAVHGYFSAIVANQYQVTSGWGEQEEIEARNEFEPAYIAVGANGDGLAYWHSGEGLDLVAAPYSVGGGWGEPETIGGPGAALSKIVIDPRGHAIAMWAQSDGPRVGVWSNQYTNEAGWGVAELVQSDARFQDVAINASGAAVAVWVRSDETQEIVWSRRYTPGIGWGAAERVSAAFSGHGSSKVGMDDAGNAIALWEQGDFHRSLGSNRYTPGSGWGEPELVSEESQGFALGVDPDGDATVLWASGSGRPGIWANRYE